MFIEFPLSFLYSFVDVDVDKPDEKSIMTYVAQFLKHYPNPHQSEIDGHHDEVFFKFSVLYLVLDENCLIVFLKEMSLKQARTLGVCE